MIVRHVYITVSPARGDRTESRAMESIDRATAVQHIQLAKAQQV